MFLKATNAVAFALLAEAVFAQYGSNSSAPTMNWPNSTDSCWTGNEAPHIQYVPFFNLNNNPFGTSTYFDGQLYRSAVTSSRFEDAPFALWAALDNFGSYLHSAGETALVYARNSMPGSFIIPHFHQRTELSCVFAGTSKLTVISSFKGPQDQPTAVLRGGKKSSKKTSLESLDSSAETFLVHAGECFFIPTGFTHYFHNVGEEPLHILNMFNFGNINVGTDRIQDIIRGFDQKLIAETLEVDEAIVEKFDLRNVDYHPIYEGWSIEESIKDASEDSNFKISNLASKNLTLAPRSEINGEVRTHMVDASVYPMLERATLSVAYTEIAPGARMEPYWVENADEIIFVQEGSDLKITRGEKWNDECLDTFVVSTEYYAIHEQGTMWSIENNNDTETAKIYRFFNSNRPTANTLHDWYNKLPEEIRKSVFYPNEEM